MEVARSSLWVLALTQPNTKPQIARNTNLNSFSLIFLTGRIPHNGSEMNNSVTCGNVLSQESFVQNISRDDLKMRITYMRQEWSRTPHKFIVDYYLVTTLEQYLYQCWPKVTCTACNQHALGWFNRIPIAVHFDFYLSCPGYLQKGAVSIQRNV